MRTVYFHIGQFKTGSTSIQEFLSKNQNYLRNHGYFVPRTPWEINTFTLRLFESFYQDINPFESEDTASILTEMQATPLNLLYSSEYLGVYTNHLDKLKDIFKDFQHKVIIYIRRADYYFESAYNQLVRNHLVTNAETIDKYIELFNAVEADRHLTIEKWGEVFGKENIKVLLFEEQYEKNDLYKSFFSAINAAFDNTLYIPTYKMNTSLPVKVISLLKEINAYFHLNIEKAIFVKSAISRAFHHKSFDSFGRETKFLTNEQRKNIIRASRSFDDKIATEYLGRNHLFNYEIKDNGSVYDDQFSIAETKELICKTLEHIFDERSKK